MVKNPLYCSPRLAKFLNKEGEARKGDRRPGSTGHRPVCRGVVLFARFGGCLPAGLCIAGCLNMQKGRILTDAPSRNCVTTVSFLALTSQ